MPSMKRKRVTRRRPRQVNTMRRYLKRRRRFGRIANLRRDPIRVVKEQSLGNLNIPVGVNGAYWAFAPTLGDITNSSEFTVLFDQYRLRSVIVKFRLISPPEANNTPSILQYYPDIAVTVDHDDATAPTSYDTLLQYGKVKQGILRPNTWFNYKCHPTAAVMYYRTSTTTAYGPASSKQWFDCNNADIPFYGIKAGVNYGSIGTLTSAVNIEIRMVYVFEFKNSR